MMDSSTSSSSHISSVSINNLPREMLLEVFSYLDQGQLLNTIPQVCKQWETLHSDPTLYRRFNFTKQAPSTDDVLKLLRMAKWLISLELDKRNDTNVILDCVSKSNQCLETLLLRDCYGSPSRKSISSVSLRRVLERCNLIQHLSLKRSYCHDRNVYNEIGLRLPALRSVDLGKPTRFNSQALLNIAKQCRKLEGIGAYDIERYSWEDISYTITDNIVSTLCHQLEYLQIIEIDFYSCTDASMFVLSMCGQLTTLRLHYATNVTDIGIMAISHMPHIVKFSLSKNDCISTHGWLTFLQQPIMWRLQELRLFLCLNVNQEARNMILNNPYNLRELRLWTNEFYCLQLFNPGNHE